MSKERDPYSKLRPESATPLEEICQCSDRPPLVLQDHLSALPLACLRCKGEVPPERIGFSTELAERIAFWRNFHRAFITLWLDSAEYESWARKQLEDPTTPVNVRGLDVVEELNNYRRTYYWWFHDNKAESFEPPSDCPRCKRELQEFSGLLVCNQCSIVVPHD